MWDILGESGRTVGVIMWLVTWPPEPVNGYLVSDYIKYDWRRAESPGPTTFPPELEALVLEHVARADDIPDGLIERFVAEGALDDERLRRRARPLRSAVAVDRAAVEMGLRLARERPVDFLAVYMPGVDIVSHHFWTEAFPETGPGASAQDVSAFGEVVERYYDHADDMVGAFLELADANTTVIVASDHGHSGPKPRGDGYAHGIAMHDPTGVVVLWGADIVGGRELARPSVLDIAPTVLALYGLPVAADQDGRVLTEAISRDFARAHPVTAIDTYEPALAGGERPGDEAPGESPVDDEIRDQLRSLGYIE